MANVNNQIIDPILNLYESQLPSYRLIWQDNLSVGKNLINLFSSLIYNLSYPEIVVTYSMVSTRITKVLPILVLYGKPGTGKSTCLSLINTLRGLDKPFTAGQSTYASLRNWINNNRVDIEGNYLEGLLLAIDNLQINHLSIGDNLYNFFLTGYDRKTSLTSIASEKRGENIIFDTYCPKIISTVYPLHQDSTLSELKRRLIAIEFKQYDNLFLTLTNKFDLSNLSQVFYSFWNNLTYTKFVQLKNKIILEITSNNLVFLNELLKFKIELFLDLITTSILLGIFKNLQDCFDYYSDYVTWLFADKDLIEQYLEVYLNTLPNKDLVYLKPLKDYIDSLKINGAIDNISFKEIKQILVTQFNYKLTQRGLEKCK